MYIMGIVNLTNIGLAFLLVFGYGPIPALGVAGAGLAGGLSRGLGGILVVWFLFSEYSPIELDWEAGLLQIDGSIVRGILDIGLPAAGENLVRQASQLLYTMLIAGLGTMAIAANQIAMSVQSLSFMPGFGFGMAATALVGQNLGAQKPDRASSAGWESLKWAMLISCTMGVLFFFFPSVLMGFYTGNSEVIQLGTGPLQIIAFSQPFLASIMVLAGGLRGAGDTRYVMYLTTFGNWGIRLVFSYILGFVVGWGLLGVWVAMAMDQVIRGSLVALRFRSGKWKDIDVEMADSQPAESTASEVSADSKSSKASLDQAAGRN
jgi:putative MATE family efflux protein